MFHTTIVPIFRPLLLALTIMFFFAACKPGDPGPEGPAGPVGNANVTQVTFSTPFTPSTSARSFPLPANMDKATVEKSLVVVYLQTANDPGLWYQLPGLVVTDDFRYYINTGATPLSISIIRSAGTVISSVRSIRILIIPATTATNARKAAVDYADYKAVKAFFALPD